jgi:uncharacterized membrane protein YqgA involved in biofilm formation
MSLYTAKFIVYLIGGLTCLWALRWALTNWVSLLVTASFVIFLYALYIVAKTH